MLKVPKHLFAMLATGGEKDVQCAHRFTPDGKAFVTYGDRDVSFAEGFLVQEHRTCAVQARKLFAERCPYHSPYPQDGFCCQSFGHLPQCNPLPIPHPSFMNTCLKRVGPVPYEGPYFKVYMYTYFTSSLPQICCGQVDCGNFVC